MHVLSIGASMYYVFDMHELCMCRYIYMYCEVCLWCACIYVLCDMHVYLHVYIEVHICRYYDYACVHVLGTCAQVFNMHVLNICMYWARVNIIVHMHVYMCKC